MKGQKVDLVHYVNGERVVIGKAVVDFDGTHFDITAKITHDDGSGIYGAIVGDVEGLSIDFKPREIKARTPLPPDTTMAVETFRKKGKGKKW